MFTKIKVALLIPIFMLTAYNPSMAQNDTATNYIKLSQSLLYTARTGEPVDSQLKILKNVSPELLNKQLDTDNKRFAFWINIYNAVTQFSLKKNPEQYKNRGEFFKKELVTIAGQDLSLDDIEHGILRRSKVKLSYGYVNKLFPGEFEKMFRVKKPDYRVHFTLNCGAQSCPPIAYYDDTKIDAQMQLATKGHLNSEAVYDSVKNEVALPAFMSWFRADFGGKKGMQKILHDLKIVPANKTPELTFKEYNWNIYLNNFKELNP